jgi:uncharacterized protein (UPF0332 family)
VNFWHPKNPLWILMTMKDNKIAWCIKQKKGITLIEQKPHLSDAYLKEAENTLDQMIKLKGKWQVILAYYACYNVLYAILQKIGIKTEIHDCSIEMMKHIPGFSLDSYNFLTKLKKKRINCQYYLENEELTENELKKITTFILNAKAILNFLNSEQINQLRAFLKHG